MTIEKNLNGTSAIFAVTGRLDTQTAPELEKEVDGIVSSIKELTFDMTGLEYVSSAGLRVILKAQKIMNTKVCSFFIVNSIKLRIRLNYQEKPNVSRPAS